MKFIHISLYTIVCLQVSIMIPDNVYSILKKDDNDPDDVYTFKFPNNHPYLSNSAIELIHRKSNGRVVSSMRFYWVGKFPRIPPGIFRLKGAYDHDGELLS